MSDGRITVIPDEARPYLQSGVLDAERAEIQQAAAMVRKTRQGFLGMPRIPQPLPDLRPERPA
ncbi:hypothetical protein P6B95_01875 [Streptomyces atratus]|uniref:hypothetical protein n=1 Tax=Streptomyces atratus TaxID=1893 RepID=UPI00166FCFF6|nr:hypothetical protein [Streptomyces atratus]WPW26323.1 hypothetical protein P6B95_01875 [Streptomyces atratus]GGT65981.1 hypothetical protein GCM10010207_76350 [Streptomyces atratus]